MAQINEAKKNTLATLGYTGSVDDAYHNYLVAESGQTLLSTQDLEKYLFSELGYTGAVYDMWFEFLRDNGFTNSLQDMLHAFWNSDSAGLSPLYFSELYAPLTHSLVLERGTGSPTFTRATTATFRDWEGVLKTVPSGCARFEGARMVRNHVTGSSENLTNAAWAKTTAGDTVTGGVTDFPSGKSQSTRITPDGTTTFHGVNQTIAIAVGNTLAVSVSMKDDGCTYGYMLIGGANKEAVFNLATGTVSNVSAGVTADIESEGDGWYLCSLIRTVGAAEGNIYTGPTTSAATGNSSAAVANKILMTGVQWEDVTGQADQTASEYVSVGVGVRTVATEAFDDAADWTLNPGWSVAGGVMTGSGAASQQATYNGAAFYTGQKVEVSGTVTAYTSGSFIVADETGASNFTVGAAGAFSGVVTFPGGTDNIILFTAGGFVGSVDNLVLKLCDHGAGVDGVEFFNTDRDGAVIPAATNTGYLPEDAATQLIAVTADIRDMTTANWVLGATMTRARTSVGADGVANSATRLTGGAVAATNTILYTVVAAASSRTYSALVRRVTGTGPVRIIQTGTETDISPQLNTVGYALVQLTASVLNVAMGFKIDTNGDAIDVDFNQFESAVVTYNATSRIATGGGVRNKDELEYTSAGNISGTAGWAYAEITYPRTQTAASPRILDTGSIAGIPLYLTDATRKVALHDGTAAREGAALTLPVTTPKKVASTWGGATSIIAVSGVTTEAAFDGAMTTTSIHIGYDHAIPGNALNGTIRNVRIGQRQLSASEMQAITS